MNGITLPDPALNSGRPFHPKCTGCFWRPLASTLTPCNIPNGFSRPLSPYDPRRAAGCVLMFGGELSWYLLRWPAVALVIATVTVVGLLSAISIDCAHATEHKPIRWLFNGPSIAAIAADSEVTQLLDNAQPFIMTGRRVDAIPPG